VHFKTGHDGREPCFADSPANLELPGPHLSFDDGRLHELRTVRPPSARAVEQDAIPLRLPDGAKAKGSRTMEAEKYAAGLSSPMEHLLSELKLIRFETFQRAKRVSDIATKFFNTLNTLRAFEHCVNSLTENRASG